MNKKQFEQLFPVEHKSKIKASRASASRSIRGFVPGFSASYSVEFNPLVEAIIKIWKTIFKKGKKKWKITKKE